MVDAASITIAVLSLATSIIVAVFTGLLNIYTDDRKAEKETERLLRKYRDPLLLASQDLQARLYNIVELNIISYLHGTPEQQDCLIIYTAYLLGQYLSWTHVLRQQAQFACFATNEKGRTKKVVQVLGSVQRCLNTDAVAGEAFLLWKGQQNAIGELMTVAGQDAGGTSQMYCMGFAEFTRKWKAGRPACDGEGDIEKSDSSQVDDEKCFRSWFATFERGLYQVDQARRRGDHTVVNRLRRLQHLLLDLIDALDPDENRKAAQGSKRVTAAPACTCSVCGKEKRSPGRV